MDSEKDPSETDLLVSTGPILTPNCHEDSLADKISRINFQRANLGGFRSLTEKSLRDEITEQNSFHQNGVESDPDLTEEDEDDDSDQIKKLSNARQELLGQIESAHQSAMFALDFISLSLSKDMPAQAVSTVSPELRELVGLGILGLDKLNAPRTKESLKHETRQIVTGWQVQSLKKTVDSILASATRLEKEIELETKYWGQILDISNNGWAICRLPSEKQTLGVRIGFPEASSAFQSLSLAALRRNPDGSIFLDQGLSETIPQAIRVRVETNGSVTGSTTTPFLLSKGSPVEALILQARNTIFAEELWQELQREARTLLAFDVSSSVSTITCVLTPSKIALIDLVPLSSKNCPSPNASDDHLAKFIHCALHLSLSWAHRQAHRRRVQPSPPTKPSPLIEPYALIRPLLTRLAHERTINSLANFLLPLTTVLRKASIPASYSINRSSLPLSSSLTKAEKVLTSLTAHLEAIFTVSILPDTELTLTTRTSTSRDMIPVFLIQLDNNSPLHTLCPPPGIFHRINDVIEWVLWCTSCALASHLISSLPNTDNELQWCLSANPSIIRREVPDLHKACRFISLNLRQIYCTHTGKLGVRLCVSWEKIDDLRADNDVISEVLAETINHNEKNQKRKCLEMFSWIAWGGKKIDVNPNTNYEIWDGIENDEIKKSLVDVVRAIWNIQEKYGNKF